MSEGMYVVIGIGAVALILAGLYFGVSSIHTKVDALVTKVETTGAATVAKVEATGAATVAKVETQGTALGTQLGLVHQAALAPVTVTVVPATPAPLSATDSQTKLLGGAVGAAPAPAAPAAPAMGTSMSGNGGIPFVPSTWANPGYLNCWVYFMGADAPPASFSFPITAGNYQLSGQGTLGSATMEILYSLALGGQPVPSVGPTCVFTVPVDTVGTMTMKLNPDNPVWKTRTPTPSSQGVYQLTKV